MSDLRLKESREHWNRRYDGSSSGELTWYQPRPEQSLNWIISRTKHDSGIIDLGAGSSTLVDHLLKEGYTDLSLLDLSEVALSKSRQRLGKRAKDVEWIVADLRAWSPQRSYDLVHDRAVFHFLTEEADRQEYKVALEKALLPGGTFIIGTFAPEGPEKCSALPIVQYDAAAIEKELGANFKLIESVLEQHPTPKGSTQLFHWALFEFHPAS